MNDLNAEERSLFDAARAGYEPNQENRKKVLSGVLLRAGVVAGVTSAASAGAAATGVAGAPLAAATASSGAIALASKVALWMAIGGAVGVGGYEISRSQGRAASAQRPAAASTASSVASGPHLSSPGAAQVAATLNPDPPARPPVPEPNRARLAGAQRELALSAALPVSIQAQRDKSVQPAIAPHAPAVAAFPADGSRAATSMPAPSAAGLALSVEARALAKVQSALKEGLNAEALRLVEEQRQQFAHGELQQERDAARIVALCAVGRVADARSAARDFLSNSPRSPFAARIRASCAGDQ